MKLGLGLSLASYAVRSAAVGTDPASLSHTGLWLANGSEYDGSPWPGIASAGTSGTKSLSEATNPPATGATVNGYTPADFDGSNDVLALEGTLGDYLATDAYSGWALVNVDSISTDSGNTFDNDAIISMNGSAYFLIGLRSSGKVIMRHVDTGGLSEYAVSADFSAGAWTFVQWRFDGATIGIRVGDGAWSALSAPNLGGLSNPAKIGVNYANAQFLDGKVLGLGLSDTAFDDGDFDGIKSYLSARYALSL